MDPAYYVEAELQPGVITLEGEIGYGSLANLLEQARSFAEQPVDVEVHWTEAKWVHFACLQLFVSLKRTLEQSGKHLTFDEPSAEVAQAIRVFNLTPALGVN